MSKEKITRTKFAVGHFLTNDPDDPASFAELAKRFAPRLREVYFPWPGLSNARAKVYDKPDDEERIAADLKYCREHGKALYEFTLDEMRETIPEATEEFTHMFDPRRSAAMSR